MDGTPPTLHPETWHDTGPDKANAATTGQDISTELSAIPASARLAGDLLRGADTIAEYLFGSRADRRKVYHLAETSRLPVFRLGSVLCARRSVLLAWIAAQEARAVRPGDR